MGQVMTPIIVLLATILLLLMFKPTRIPVVVMLGAVLMIWLMAGH
jgi:hypothetical protein